MLPHQRCLITGATSGIGRATALALGRRGAELILVGRNERAGTALARRIGRADSGATAAFIRADLSAQQDVRELAAEISRRWERLDILINNAGAKFDHYQKSADGIELTFATNHLGHFLLSALILERLLASPKPRVITVSSGTHHGVRGPIDWCLGPGNYDRKAAYAQSKLANLLFSCELARRFAATPLTSNAVDPGGVATRLGLNNGLTSWLRHMVYYALKRQLISPRRGADTVVYLAGSPEVEGVTGRYFFRRGEAQPSPLARDLPLAADLWRRSVELTGLGESVGLAWRWFRP